jgi:hypothetical protein
MSDILGVINNFKEFDYSYVSYEAELKIDNQCSYMIFDAIIRKNPTENGVSDNVIDVLVLKDKYEPNKRIDCMRVAQMKNHKTINQNVQGNEVHYCKLIIVKDTKTNEVGAYIQANFQNKGVE